jgi:alkanesulfonate monooxygenase SsuD/methylene tetrahydromethanopterin reductase-like flavin-dependent oxidoreductase (luciferase family)
VVERQGFGAAAAAIREAFAAGDHDAMVAAVPDAMIDTFAVAGTAAQVRDQLRRYDKAVDHLIVYPPSFRMTPERCDAAMYGAVNAPETRACDAPPPR